MEHVDTLVTDQGKLTFHFKLHTPQWENESLPEPPYIFINYIAAEPRGARILQRHAGEMIARIRAKLKSDRTIIFQPANGNSEDDAAQKKLETYYQSCGFDYLPSSRSNWWMTWPEIKPLNQTPEPTAPNSHGSS
jgi:hypothetical protein